MIRTLLAFAKKHAVLITIALSTILIISLFHQILKPFIIALIVVYLIDPLVSWMNKGHIGKRHIPRGFAVIVAYLLFLSALTGIGFAVIPSLTTEISNASEALPKYFMQIKNEDIPRWNQKLDDIIFKLSRKNSQDIANAVNIANTSLEGAFAEAQNALQKNNDDAHGKLAKNDKDGKPEHEPVLFKIRKSSSGSYEILPGDENIKLVSAQDGSLNIQHTEQIAQKNINSGFNIEQEITRAFSSLLESGSEYAGNALSFIQNTIVVIINTFVQFILVFMLAAFIAIDSPKLMKAIRALFENKNGEAKGFDEYKSKLTRGLSGVVRGQLIICCINGTLTGLGLWVFGVEFSMLLGLIAGLFSIVPVFGTIISTIPAVLLGLVQGPLTAVLVLCWILFVHFLDTNFFTPKIVGSASNLHPVIIIFAILAGESVAGVLGLILAVPTASILQTTIRFILDQTKKERLPAPSQTTPCCVATSCDQLPDPIELDTPQPLILPSNAHPSSNAYPAVSLNTNDPSLAKINASKMTKSRRKK